MIALLLVLLTVLFEVLTAAVFVVLAVRVFCGVCDGFVEDDSRAASKSVSAAANCSKPKPEPLFEGRCDLLELRMEKSEGGS